MSSIWKAGYLSHRIFLASLPDEGWPLKLTTCICNLFQWKCKVIFVAHLLNFVKDNHKEFRSTVQQRLPWVDLSQLYRLQIKTAHRHRHIPYSRFAVTDVSS